MEVLQRTANRGSISTDTGYNIDNSAAFGGANGIQFNPSSDGNQRTWTMSLWLKRSEISTETTIFGAQNTAMVLMDPDWFRFHLYTGSTTYYYDTDNSSTRFRDTSAWYHFVFQCDTTQGTAANRTKLYINGALYTGARGGADTSANIPQNTEFQLNDNTVNFNVGYFYAGNEQLDGYLADVHFTDGVANDADAFGEYDDDSGIWKPKAYEGSYGTNGFYLEFKEPAASSTGIGKDTSGNGHNFSTGGTYPSQATDTPTNNFCTFNPLMTQNNPPTISEGATKSTGGGGTWNQTWGNMGVKNGKWYYEFKVTNTSSSGYFGASTTPAEGSSTSANTLMYNTSFMLGSPSRIDYYYWQNGSQVSNESTGWGTISTNDIIGIALDLDSSTKKFIVYKNGSALNGSGTDLPTNMQDEFIFPLYVQYENRADEANFGGYTISSISSAASDGNGHGTFEIAPPSGYLAICTKNIAETG
jgi:hypothetical protein